MADTRPTKKSLDGIQGEVDRYTQGYTRTREQVCPRFPEFISKRSDQAKIFLFRSLFEIYSKLALSDPADKLQCLD